MANIAFVPGCGHSSRCPEDALELCSNSGLGRIPIKKTNW
jgi:hypothetical protein